MQKKGISRVLFDAALSDWALVLLLQGAQLGQRLYVKLSYRSEWNAGNFLGLKKLVITHVSAGPRGLFTLRSAFTCIIFIIFFSWKGGKAENLSHLPKSCNINVRGHRTPNAMVLFCFTFLLVFYCKVYQHTVCSLGCRPTDSPHSCSLSGSSSVLVTFCLGTRTLRYRS